MKATYNKNAKTKFTNFHRKENKCYFDSYSALVPATDFYGNPIFRAVVDLRLYGTGNSNTAVIWVHAGEIHTSGTGQAGGYGYHWPAAAAAEAITNAGFTLSQNISGVGECAIESAVKAIAESVGHPNCAVFHAHP